jgi:hypothetical protein
MKNRTIGNEFEQLFHGSGAVVTPCMRLHGAAVLLCRAICRGPHCKAKHRGARSAAPMSQFFQIHPENPQARLIRQAVDIVRAGGVVVYPTDSAYALGCQIGDKAALDRIRRIRRSMTPQLHPRVPRPVGDGHLRPRRQHGVSAAESAHAGCLHVHFACHLRGAASPHAPEAAHRGSARARQRDRPGAPRRSQRAADERYPDHARTTSCR